MTFGLILQGIAAAGGVSCRVRGPRPQAPGKRNPSLASEAAAPVCVTAQGRITAVGSVRESGVSGHVRDVCPAVD